MKDKQTYQKSFERLKAISKLLKDMETTRSNDVDGMLSLIEEATDLFSHCKDKVKSLEEVLVVFSEKNEGLLPPNKQKKSTPSIPDFSDRFGDGNIPF